MASFRAVLAGIPDADRQTVLLDTHPVYVERKAQWQTLLDAYEHAGGFRSGGYLEQYANEEPSAFRARKRTARYQNYARTLVGIYARYLFRGGIDRETSSDRLGMWWTDVDGSSLTMTDAMKRSASVALATGQSAVLIDREGMPSGPRRVDDRTRVSLAHFSPLDVLDWRMQGGRLVGLKLHEHGTATDLLMTGPSPDRVLLWDMETWARVTEEGEVIDEQNHGLGLIPFVVIRGERSTREPIMCGHPVLGDANTLKALYNRASEQDGVLRDQAFSILTAEISNPDVKAEDVRTEMGNEVGTTRALIGHAEFSYKTPDLKTSDALQQNQAYMVQELFRLASVFYQRDSKEAETAEAIALKHSELNEILSGMAQDLEAAERQAAKLWFLWTEPSVEQGQRAFDAAAVQVSYPREFFITDLLRELEKYALALSLDLGATATLTLKKAAIQRLVPGLSEETWTQIQAELEQGGSDAADRLQRDLLDEIEGAA